MKFRLYAIRVFCFDWTETLAFYRDQVGFEVFYADEAQGWAQFDLGDVYLGLERLSRDDPEASTLVGRFVGTSVQVENIHEVVATLKSRGVPFSGEPEVQPWGGVLAHIQDPAGNVVTLMGSVAADQT